MVANIQLTIAKSLYKNCKKGHSVLSNIDDHGYRAHMCNSNTDGKWLFSHQKAKCYKKRRFERGKLWKKHFATCAAPRTECLESICYHFSLLTLLLLIESVQSCMTVYEIILCEPERGHSVIDIYLFSMFWIKLLELKVVFRNFFCWMYNIIVCKSEYIEGHRTSLHTRIHNINETYFCLWKLT